MEGIGLASGQFHAYWLFQRQSWLGIYKEFAMHAGMGSWRLLRLWWKGLQLTLEFSKHVHAAQTAEWYVERSCLHHRNSSGSTPLHLAAGTGNAAVVAYLLKQRGGQAVKAALDDDGKSPLAVCLDCKSNDWKKTAQIFRDAYSSTVSAVQCIETSELIPVWVAQG